MNDFQLLLTLLKPSSPWLLFVSYMIHTLVHTWKRPWCSIFKEINVKRQHIFIIQPSKIIFKI